MLPLREIQVNMLGCWSQGLSQSITWTRVGGTIVLVGLTGGRAAAVDADAIVLGELTIHGIVSAKQEHWHDVVRLLSQGAIKSIVSHRSADMELPVALQGRKH